MEVYGSRMPWPPRNGQKKLGRELAAGDSGECVGKAGEYAPPATEQD